MKNAFFKTAIYSCLLICSISCKDSQQEKNIKQPNENEKQNLQVSAFDSATYNKALNHLADGDTTGLWPVKTRYPLSGAILPYSRVVAFYGNLYSKKMGILGVISKGEMI